MGGRYAFAPQSTLIASLIYNHVEREEELDFVSRDRSRNTHGYTGEAQYLFSAQHLDIILGAGHYDLDSSIGSHRHSSGYVYTHFRYPASFTWTMGISVDSLRHGLVGDFDRINPKLGLSWDIGPRTALRMAAFSNLQRTLDAAQTIEPTQVSGFNQFFDDFDGTESRRYGIGLDHKFPFGIYSGLEYSKRDLKIPIAGAPVDDWDEELYRLYVHWLPHPRWAVALGYLREEFFSGTQAQRFGGNPPSTVTQSLPFQLSYYHPTGLFGRVLATYVHQTVELTSFNDSGGIVQGEGEDEFVTTDVSIGYRLPKRFGIVSVDVRNLFDVDFDFQACV